MAADPRKLLAQADKAAQGASGGFSFFGGRGEKWENAADLYLQAANAFRMQKQSTFFSLCSELAFRKVMSHVEERISCFISRVDVQIDLTMPYLQYPLLQNHSSNKPLTHVIDIEAGQTFEKAASIQQSKLSEPDDMANTLTEAFKVYRKDSPSDAARVLSTAISHYASKGNTLR